MVRDKFAGRFSANEEAVHVALQVLRSGLGKKAAARVARVHYTTLESWLESGEEFSSMPDDTLDDVQARLKKFYLDYMACIPEHQVSLISVIDQASAGDWRAAAWLLERLYPKKFGSRMQMSGEVRHPKTDDVDLSKLTTEELLQLKALREKLES